MLGSRCFGALGAWWDKSEGAAVADHHHFINSSLPLFLFFGHFFTVALAFLLVHFYIFD
jgi:hypothetical protein